MELNLDFIAHQSIGNRYGENSEDNHKSFEKARTLYTKDKKFIQDTIHNSFENFGVEITKGMEVTIPVGHHSEAGFIKRLKFKVTGKNENEVNLSLTKVLYN